MGRGWVRVIVFSGGAGSLEVGVGVFRGGTGVSRGGVKVLEVGNGCLRQDDGGGSGRGGSMFSFFA